MPICQYEEVALTRDMDLIRELLIGIEQRPDLDGRNWLRLDTPEELGVPGHQLEEVNYHLTLLIEAGFLKGNFGHQRLLVSKLTWQGHEFLDDIRDHGIWAKIKERVSGLPSVGLAIIAELAKAEVKKKLGLQ